MAAIIDCIKKLKNIISKKQIWVMLGLVFGTLIGAILETGVVGMMLPFMNALVGDTANEGNMTTNLIRRVFHCTSSNQLLFTMALLLTCLYIIKGVYKWFLQWLQARKIAEFRTEISCTVFNTLIHRPYKYHLDHNTAEMQRLVTSDIDLIVMMLTQLMLLIAESSVSIGIIVLMVFVDPKLTFCAIALMGCLMIITNGFIAKQIRQSGATVINNSSEMLKWVQQTAGGIKNIYTSKKQGYFENRYAVFTMKTAQSNAKYTTLNETPKIVIEAVSMASIFIYMAVTVLNGNNVEKMLPLLATFALAAMRLIPVANRISGAIGTMNFSLAPLNAIYTVIGGTHKTENNADNSHAEDETNAALSKTIHTGITVKDLAFRFDDTEKYLFKDLNVSIPAQKSVAFVGATGSGKTTLADIILGILTPEHGQVLADEYNIFEESDWWANCIGYVPQFVYLCDDTIRSNVAFGVPEDRIDNELVMHCLEKAEIRSFVEKLPDGIMTYTGENGVRLSGGQRQRIGIARALYTCPQFLVMDEATSALDYETEKAIIETIDSLAGKMTLLIIAHRMSTIEKCDLVYSIEEGKAVLIKGSL